MQIVAQIRFTAAIFLMPVIAFLYVIWMNQQELVTFAEKELAGIRGIQGLQYVESIILDDFFATTTDSEIASSKSTSLLKSSQKELSASHGHNSQSLRQKSAGDSRLNRNTSLPLRNINVHLSDSMESAKKQNQMFDLQKELNDLFLRVVSFQSGNEEKTMDLLNLIHATIAKICDQSNLILDPVLDSYYVMDAISSRFLSLKQNLSALFSVYSKCLKAVGRDRSERVFESLTKSATVLHDFINSMDALDKALNIAISFNKEHKLNSLKESTQDLAVLVRKMVKRLFSALLLGEFSKGPQSQEEMVRDFGLIYQHIQKHQKNCTQALASLLNERVADYYGGIRRDFSFCGVFLFFSLLYVFFFERKSNRMRQELEKIEHVLSCAQRGLLVPQLGESGVVNKDLVGCVNWLLHKERENFIQREGMNVLRYPLLMIKEDGKIFYSNESFYKLARELKLIASIGAEENYDSCAQRLVKMTIDS